MTEGNSERAIGRLEGKVDALVGAVEDQTEKSQKRYARIYQELEKIRLDAAESRRDVGIHAGFQIADADTISDIRKWRERFVGMQMMWAMIFTFLGGALAAFWKWIAVKLGLI
ncbi:MAG: hypothetical protein H5U11_04245 [Rhizobium sp.]|nr:hypothetical protein [Rhizobium sp.]